MTVLEDRLRDTLHDMADEAVGAPLLQRLENRPEVHTNRRRLVAVTAVAAAAAIVAATSYVVLRADEPSIIEPIVRPPKVFRLSDDPSTTPGRSRIAVVVARNNSTATDFTHEKPAYVLATSSGVGVLVKESDVVPTWTNHLSADGTRLVRQLVSAGSGGPNVEIVNLVTGAISDLGGQTGDCATLSPDNNTVAAHGPTDLRLIDVGSGSSRTLRTLAASDAVCRGLAWSPDSRLLAVNEATGSVVLDRQGRLQLRLPDASAVNGSMSWSPDGRAILLYVRSEGHFVVRRVEDGSETVLVPPAGAVRPEGWAGTRVVWIAGQPGDQSLVSTDQHGGDAQSWMHLDVGGYPVERVSWSRTLSGTAG